MAIDDFNPAEFASEMQLRTRKEYKFDEIEAALPDPKPVVPAYTLDGIKNRLWRLNPFQKSVTNGDVVWLFDNTAFRTSRFGTWQAEFVAAVYEHEPKGKVVDIVSGIAKVLKLADDAKERETIEKRLMPFLWDVQPARTLTVTQEASRKHLKLGPTGTGGCSSDVLKVATNNRGDLVKAKGNLPGGVTGLLDMQTFYAGEKGWAIISDIDDTIKITATSDPIGILRETFIEEPRPVQGMPELYREAQTVLPKDCPWFYLSASPYNLYPFLRDFRNKFYPPGTLILRDSSWKSIAGLLASLTLNTEEYKVDRMKKIHTWLPKRKFIVLGDSTQSDPEAYGEIYRTFPSWIRLILIRKATDLAMLGLKEKNEPARFEKAFQNIPQDAWHVFEEPSECASIIKGVIAKDGS